MNLSDAWRKTLVYFGLADDPDGPRAVEAQARRDALDERLEALERRVADNTSAVEALRAEVMRLSAKL